MVDEGAILCGLMVINKPWRISSMGVVRIIRRQAGGVKTGHAGTLDPLATGVLVVCLGQATKWVDRIMDQDKEYLTEIDLSAFSSTEDCEGEISPLDGLITPEITAIRKLLDTSFIGNIYQLPPAFSAIRIRGKRAYQIARTGVKFNMPPREVEVQGIDIVEYNWPMLTLRIRCSKGTYIRSLARDIGYALGVGGYLTSLVRTGVGQFTLDKAIALDDVPEHVCQSDLYTLQDFGM